MSDRDHAREMLRLAEDDRRAVGGMMDGAVFTDALFGFHAQQAVEKALKAWLSLRQVKYPRIHDLEELFALLAEKGEGVHRFRALARLTVFAVELWYAGGTDDSPPLDRSTMSAEVGAFVGYVRGLVEGSG